MRFLVHIAVVLLLSGLFLLASAEPRIPAPTLVSPANDAVMDNGCDKKPEGITWDFDWSDVPSATAYNIKVWSGSTPNNPVLNDMNVKPSSYHYTSTDPGYIINQNLKGWRWMVRAKVDGVWGPWSKVGNFQVERLNTDCP